MASRKKTTRGKAAPQRAARKSAAEMKAKKGRRRGAAEEPETLPLFGEDALSASAGRAAAASLDASAAKPSARQSHDDEDDDSAEEGAPRARSRKPAGKYSNAEDIGLKQREISVSEFFAKNRHMLGFDSPTRAILTTVKEAVDNSLDACEEAGLPPDIIVEIHETGENRYRLVIEDSGPGIVKQQVPKIFGKLLYGSKFHELRQSRGQQGIGISAAVMYSQLTVGKPVKITSRTGPKSQAHRYELQIDTKKNAPIVLDDGVVEWERPHGTRIEMEIEAVYQKGKRSVDQYLHQVALANPHADIRFIA
ncbi:MAG TPA: DNA topoisomerase VI subunit B, partial [Candidatus Krumholzibacteria bacterium]|nr:DNA topoisomerase VI subunit B [Candidatus Krumholzibacteria bacterium]